MEKFTNNLLKKSFIGDCCAEKECSHRSCIGFVTRVVNVKAICASQAPVVKKVPVDSEQLRTSSVERGRKSWKG